MLKVAITGNIAAGKSSVGEILKQQGYVFLDADHIAHDLLDCNQEVVREVKSIFEGHDILCDATNLSRNKIGQIVFKDKKLKRKLELLIHPLVLERLNEMYDEYPDQSIIFVSVPLLFEANFEKYFDKIILVTADDDIRLERLRTRNLYTLEHAKDRMNSQESQESKIQKSDFVIENNSDSTTLSNSLGEILKKLGKQEVKS